jgi:hypothetical protein
MEIIIKNIAICPNRALQAKTKISRYDTHAIGAINGLDQ